jgi:hypothetical protein
MPDGMNRQLPSAVRLMQSAAFPSGRKFSTHAHEPRVGRIFWKGNDPVTQASCLEQHGNMIGECSPRSNSDPFVVQPKEGPLINFSVSILWISNVLECDLKNVTFDRAPNSKHLWISNVLECDLKNVTFDRAPNSKHLKIVNFFELPLSRPPLGPPSTLLKQ